MNQKIVKMMKTTIVGLVTFLVLFNINFIVDENGFAVKMINSVSALPEGEGQDLGGGTKPGCYTYGQAFAQVYTYVVDYPVIGRVTYIGSRVQCDIGGCICYSIDWCR